MEDVLNAISTLSEINDHFNGGGVYDKTVHAQMGALFCFLWLQTPTPPPNMPVWVLRESDGEPST